MLFPLVLLFGLAAAADIREKRILSASQYVAAQLNDSADVPVHRSMFDKIDAAGCGQRPLLSNNGASELNRRIVGGTESVAYSWPAMCSLRRTTNPSFHFCGASLVKNLNGQFFLITAAHCVESQTNPSRYVAYCGIHDTSASNKPNRQIIYFNGLTIHPNYNDWTLDYDIAILRLSAQPPTNNYIQAVCLPNEGWNVDELAIVSGWGTLSSGGPTPTRLQQVVKPIKSRSTCRQRYGTSAITNRMLCAGYPDGGYDSCQGDSGGPLVTYREGRWTLTGIVSWGYGCAEVGRPGVYADVIEVKEWIGSVIN